MRPLFCFYVLLSCLFLTACDNQSSAEQPAKTPLAEYKAETTPAWPAPAAPSQAAAATAPQAPQLPRIDAVDVPQAEAPKTYTFRGNVLLPPDAYNSTEKRALDETSICGVLSPDQPDTEKYCFKFAELHNHLYDADHAGLDVWDVRGSWYLLLTREERRELWVQKDKFGVYHPYADVLKQKLLFLGDWNYKIDPTWPLQAYNGPDGAVIEMNKDKYPAMKSRSPMIVITSVAESPKKELWFKLNLINSLCEARKDQDMTPVVMDIWYPAFRLDDGLYIPTVWYYAKGC